MCVTWASSSPPWRPQASAFGQDAYPTIHHQAAALLHSLVQNHALVDGNKRLGLAGVIAFYGVNGWRFEATNDQAYDLVLATATGGITEVEELAQRLRALVSDVHDG